MTRNGLRLSFLRFRGGSGVSGGLFQVLKRKKVTVC